MSDLRGSIPSEFYRGDEEKPYCDTVGELIEQLQRLPKHLPIQQDMGEGCTVVVYNVKTNAVVEIGEDDE